MSHKERVKFRLIQMPCCGQLLCWVNPRLPNYCPECGTRMMMMLRSGEHTRLIDDNAWLEIHAETSP